VVWREEKYNAKKWKKRRNKVKKFVKSVDKERENIVKYQCRTTQGDKNHEN